MQQPVGSTEVFLEGVVRNFNAPRRFGIALVGRGTVLIHENQRGHGTKDRFVRYRPTEDRPAIQEGDIVSLCTGPGMAGTGGTATKWFLVESTSAAEKKPAAAATTSMVASAPQPHTRPTMGAAPPAAKPASRAADFLPARTVACPDKDERIKVIVRKLRDPLTTYGQNGKYGEIDIPSSILRGAGITNLTNGKKGDWFEVRCEMGRDRPVALEIRRSSGP